MRTHKFVPNLFTSALFLVSLAVCAAPRIAPKLFSLVSGNDAKIIGTLNSFLISERITDSGRAAHYSIPLLSSDSSPSLSIPPILYAYRMTCKDSPTIVIAENPTATLQRNLNKYLILSKVPAACTAIELDVSGPARATRLTTGDGYVTTGSPTRLDDLRWILEFLTEGLPLLLALIFVAIVAMYSISGIKLLAFDRTGLTNTALWISSVFFINQTGFFLRLLPVAISDDLSSKIGVGLGIISITLWIVAIVGQNPRILPDKILKAGSFALLTPVVLVGFGITASPYHRSALVSLCLALGAYLFVKGVTKSKVVALLLGTCLILDSAKIFGLETPFSSRTSWYFLCELLILDAAIRQFSYSRTQWFLHRFSHDLNSGSLNLSDAADLFRKTILDAFHFKSVVARVVTGNHSMPADLRTAKQISIPISQDKLVVIQLENSFFFELDVPAATLGLETLTNELENRLPAIFLRVLDEQTRKFDAAISAITSEIKTEEISLTDHLGAFFKRFCDQTDTRILFADYVPSTHQLKPRYILNYPENIASRFQSGFLRALPDSTFSPLSQGVHSDRIYSCPDVNILKPFLHENTVQYYEETKTISCFAFNVLMRVNGNDVRAVLYVESSSVRFDEHFKPAIQKFRGSVDSLLRSIDISDQLIKATSALSRFIPRHHVFSLMSGATVVEKDRGYLLMVDLKGSTKFSLKHGSDAWLARVEKLQTAIRPPIEEMGMTLQTFSWDAAFITLSSGNVSRQSRLSLESLACDIGKRIETWAGEDPLLREFWASDDQKARFCITYGDISRGLTVGTTETWTVTGESMAVIAKMESECKKIEGVLFTDDDPSEEGLRLAYTQTGIKIRGVGREILFRHSTWSEFLGNSKAKKAA